MPGAPRIAINGRYLDTVQTRMEPGVEPGSVSLLSLPDEHHTATVDGGGVVTLRLLALTALQLYFDGTLPADRGTAVSLEVGGQLLGDHHVEWLRCEGTGLHTEHVFLRLRPVAGKAEAAKEQ
ncbi:MAG: hypothetical protein HY901_30030 [Deltaproteobacteria bacterium]|nr:hypothetical protein [Deltaproteobacteria bacterium]